MSNQQLLLGTGASIKDYDYLEENFKIHTYKGNNTTNQIETGIDMGGRGAMVLIKPRDGSSPWELYDTDRGVNAPLIPHGTDAARSENANQDMVSFNDNGFTLGSTGGSYVNYPNWRTVSYTFKKRPKFFDIQTYSGNGTNNRQISHDLDAVAGCVWIKCTSHAEDWIVWHKDLSGTSNSTKYLKLNEANASATDSTMFNNAVQNSTTSFTLGDGQEVNGNGRTYVMYLFADNSSYPSDYVFGAFGAKHQIIRCGSYTGNGAVDGPNVGLGNYQEPQFLLIKSADHSSNWTLFDSRRGWSGTADPTSGTEGECQVLNLNTGDAEYGLNAIRQHASGFKLESDFGSINSSGKKFIFIAIAAETGRTLMPTTSGDEVFDMKYNQSGASIRNSAFGRIGTSSEIKFPADFAMIKRVNNGDHWYTASSKMEKGKYLSTSNNTAALQNSNKMDMSFMNGFGNSSFSSDSLAFMWKRSRGFDIQTYTGGGQYHYHNLGQTPQMFIVKDLHGNNPWRVATTFAYNSAGTMGGSRLYGSMDTNGFTYDTNVFSHLGSIGDTTKFLIWLDNSVAQSNHRYICFLFASVGGISQCSWYAGDGTNTKSINCGFKPRFVMIKNIYENATNSSWSVFGEPNNNMWTSNDDPVQLNSSDGKITGNDFLHSFTSTGFSLKNTSYGSTHVNLSGTRYLYYAHA